MAEDKPPRILVIAGSDSSGGAGIQADIKTVTLLGGYAMTAVTALTAQNTKGVRAVLPSSPEFVREQIAACVEDIGVDAVKIGMLGGAAIAGVVADAIEALDVPVVFDPVMVATSGAALADEATIAAFDRLMKLVTLGTPNLPELAALTDMPLETSQQVAEAAQTLLERHGCAVLAKGGHGDGNRLQDILVTEEKAASFEDERIDTRHTHGTGCTLSSAIATLLGHGQSLEHSVRLGRRFTRKAIEAAPGFGKGNGPLGHHAVRL